MNWKLIAALAVLAIAIVLLYPTLTPPVEAPSGNTVPEVPNAARDVVFILLDTLRADRVEAVRNGVQVMPNLTRYAERSWYAPRAVSPSTWTKPAMASLFTGLYYEAHSVHFSADPGDPAAVSDALPESLETFAEYLSAHGYRTIGVQTNPHMTPNMGFADGFDVYETVAPDTATQVTNTAIELSREARTPQFLYVHYMDPHNPYTAPVEYLEVFGYDAKALVESDRKIVDRFMDYFWDQVGHFVGLETGDRKFPQLTAAGREAVRTLYDADVRYMDDELKRLLEYVDEHLNDPIVVILADHGEEFWEHGSLGHGTTHYEEVLRVPLIIRAKELEPRRIEGPVETIRVAPTIAALIGLEPSTQWQATNPLMVAEGELSPAFSHTQASWPRVGIDRETIVRGSEKLIRDRATGDVALYDIDVDPLETSNIAAAHPDRVAELTALLDTHRSRIETAPASPVRVSPDSEDKERLRDVGYL